MSDNTNEEIDYSSAIRIYEYSVRDDGTVKMEIFDSILEEIDL